MAFLAAAASLKSMQPIGLRASAHRHVTRWLLLKHAGEFYFSFAKASS